MTEHEVRVRAALPAPVEAKLAQLEEQAAQSVAVAQDLGERLREARQAAAFARQEAERQREEYRRGLRQPFRGGVAVVDVEPPPAAAQAAERAAQTVARLVAEYDAAGARAQNLLRLVERCREHLGLGRETRRAAA
jgi:hypothetical protein